MLSSKHISGITILLISVVSVLCVVAMVFYDTLLPIVNTTGYHAEYENELFDTSKILDIHIIMDDAKWDEMLQNARQEEYYECDVLINGTTFSQVGIRPKGNTSLSSIASDPDNNRYSFKMEFDKFVDGQTCFGLDKLVLNNSYADTTNMKEAIIYDMFRYLDADASLYNYARISVNNEYWGVYLAVEAVEESFMLRNYGMEKGNLYKPDGMNFGGKNGEKKTANNNRFPTPPQGGFGMQAKVPDTEAVNPQNGGVALEPREGVGDGEVGKFSRGDERGGNNGFPGGMPSGGERGQRGRGFGGMGGGGNLNYTDDNLDSYQTIWNGQINNSIKADHKRVVEALKNVHQRTNVEDYIDLDQVLKYMAVHNFSVNDDSLSGSMAHNYYLYEANGKISILPWDYNLAFGGMHKGDAAAVVNQAIDDLWNGTKLFDFVLENEEYKAQYHAYYNKLVEEYLIGGKFEERYRQIVALIAPLVKTDPNSMYTYEEYKKGIEVLYEVVMLRAQSVKGQLDGIIPSTSEGQKTAEESLIDASHLNIDDLGQFMGGGLKKNEQSQTRPEMMQKNNQ